MNAHSVANIISQSRNSIHRIFETECKFLELQTFVWLSWSLEGPPPLGARASGPHEYAHYHQDSVLAHLTITLPTPDSGRVGGDFAGLTFEVSIRLGREGKKDRL